ncbi:phospholipase D family protein [Myxococcus sp. AB036A]|uniref:phospholipase D family protein n=1 Tax=Myxococcus sp. AB036A TaxID=2562793 RepID=UPI001146F727|nr:phospholipase D family protein [Myxococcus sp. AB036A]
MNQGHSAQGQRLEAREIGPAVVELIRSAKSRIVLISPYFHPWGRLVDALTAAPTRGARVTLVIRSNQPFNARRHLALQKLAAAGVSIRQVPWLHLKMYLSDAAVIETSMNLVFSSMAKGYETGILYTVHEASAGYAERRAMVKKCVEGSAPYLCGHVLAPESGSADISPRSTPTVQSAPHPSDAPPHERTHRSPAGPVASSRRNNPRAFHPWTAQEDALAQELFSQKLPLISIAQALQRTPKSVSKRLKHLGVVE